MESEFYERRFADFGSFFSYSGLTSGVHIQISPLQWLWIINNVHAFCPMWQRSENLHNDFFLRRTWAVSRVTLDFQPESSFFFWHKMQSLKSIPLSAIYSMKCVPERILTELIKQTWRTTILTTKTADQLHSIFWYPVPHRHAQVACNVSPFVHFWGLFWEI